MHSFLDTKESFRLNLMLTSVKRTVCTFTMSFDSTADRLKAYREAELFMRDHGRADKDLRNCPILLVGSDEGNRVFIKTPSGRFADITNATVKEADDIALGVVTPPAASPSTTGFLNALFGLSAAGSLDF